VRDAPVIEQVCDWPAQAGDEVQIGRRAGEEAGGDAPRQRARRRVLARCGAPEQRTGQRVR